MKQIILSIFKPENEFFKSAEKGKRVTHIVLSSLILPAIFLIISALLTQYVFAPLYFGNPATASSSAREAFGLYSLFLILILLVFLWVKYYEKRPFHTVGLQKKNAVKKYSSGFITGMVMNIVLVIVLLMSGNIEHNDVSHFAADINAIGGIMVFLFAYLIQGASEEILTRGWMLQVIGARYKPWIGVLVTSITFSLMHSGNDGAGFFASLNIFLIAIFLCLLVMKDSSIWSACGWHTAWNWTLGNIFGLSVSGTGEKASLVDLNTTGNELLSGGQFGIEGSLILTVLLIGMIALISVNLFKKEKKLEQNYIAFAN